MSVGDAKHVEFGFGLKQAARERVQQRTQSVSPAVVAAAAASSTQDQATVELLALESEILAVE